jgi:hypothetical protein
MAKSARRSAKTKPNRRKSRAGKAAGGRRRRKTAPARRRPARQQPRKKAKKMKRKAVERAPKATDNSWPVILTVMIVLLTGLIAAWQFGDRTMAANAAAQASQRAPAEILSLNDHGCGEAHRAETWMMVAHPGLVPTSR